MFARRRSPLILAACFLLACSPRSYVVSRMADAASSGGDVFARDDDPELVRDAVPFALKAMESLLASSPDHKGLLTALCKGFTQYAVAFVRQDAEEAQDPVVRRDGMERSRRLFLRAREYGVRGLSVGREGFPGRAVRGSCRRRRAGRGGGCPPPVLDGRRVEPRRVIVVGRSIAAGRPPADRGADAKGARAGRAVRRRRDPRIFHRLRGGASGGDGRIDRAGAASYGAGDGAVRGEENLPAGHLRPRRCRSGPRTGRGSWTSSTARSPSTRGRRRRSTGWATSCPSAAHAG